MKMCYDKIGKLGFRGWEWAAWRKQTKELIWKNALALSANAFIDDIQASLNSGMNDHISKPINMEELIDTITKYIKRD